jgi:hypothetical protein
MGKSLSHKIAKKPLSKLNNKKNDNDGDLKDGSNLI